MGCQRVERIANYELASRSTVGVVVYPFTACVLVTWSPFYREHFVVTGVFLAIFFLVGWLRYRWARRITERDGVVSEQEVRRFHLICVASAAAWGIFSAWGILNHHDITRWMLLTAAGAIAGGSISSLSPGRNHLFLKFVIWLLAPSVLAMMLSNSEMSRASGWIALAFSVLMAFHGSVQSRVYLQTLLKDALQTEELASARERLEMVVEGSNLGTFDWFPADGVLDLDAKLWQTLGVEEPSDSAAELSRRFHPDEWEVHRAQMLAHLKEDNGVCELDVRLLDSAGSYQVFRFRGRVVTRSRGRAERVSGTFLDITAQHQAEEELERWRQQAQQAEKLNTLGMLAGGVAHDFNNLLTAYVGCLELIELEVGPKAGFLSELRVAKESALQASGLCDQLLSYAGKRSLNREAIDLNRLIRDMKQLLGVSISRSIEVRLELDPELPLLEGDPSQLRQIVLNLITNAAEATEGTGIVRVQTRVHQGHIQLTVEDQGCGMDEKTLEKMFDPFFTTKFTGRGLGLAAVFGIVQAHQGEIEVQSVPAQGTTITISLPAPAEPLARTAVESRPITEHKRSGTVLVVDDEPALLNIYQRQLQREGFQVMTAADGAEALEVLRHQPEPILVILDLMMPRLNGLETLRELRKTFPRMPVILASGYCEQQAKPERDQYQFFLKKPFSRSDLQASLEILH